MLRSVIMSRHIAPEPTPIERIVASIGSTESLIAHSIAFVAFFLLAILNIFTWELMLLVLTTILSLEAIYLAIFIQITVNKHTQSLRDVEEDLEEISEDVEELGEDMEDIQEDLEDIQEDIEEMNEEEDEALSAKKKKQTKEEVLDQLTQDVARVLADLEALKKGK